MSVMVWPPNIDFAFNLYCPSANVLSFIMIIASSPSASSYSHQTFWRGTVMRR